jgi:uncharacterized protein (DUF302 family)
VSGMSDYGYAVEIDQGYDEAVLRARLALKAEGFSIITEMHVGGLLGPDAGQERQYLIMGAWAPAVAEPKIDSGLHAAVHLPCNVVIQETGASAVVAALDPAEEIETEDADMRATADEARRALSNVLHRVTESP